MPKMRQSPKFVCRKAVGSFALLILLGVAISAGAGNQSEPRQVGAADWSPSKAELVQKRLQQDRIRKIGAQFGRRAELEARRKAHQLETGFGSVPHAPFDEPQSTLSATQRKLDELQRKAIFIAATEKRSPTEIMGELMSVPLSTVSTSMILTTPSQGAVTGGYVLVFETASGQLIGGSSIGTAGEISLPVSAGTEIDVMVLPTAPFAFQVARGILAVADGAILLQDSIEVPLSLQDDQSQNLSDTDAHIWLHLDSYPYPQDLVSYLFGGTGSLFLSPDEDYNVKIVPTAPWLERSWQSVNPSIPELVIVLERGVALEISFDDPQDLVGVDGCQLYADLQISRSQSIVSFQQWQEFSLPIARYDEQFRLSGFTAAVPNSVAVDINLDFLDYPGSCSVESYRSQLEWFSGDQPKRIALKPRPQPNLIFRTPEGAPIPFNQALFIELDGLETYLGGPSIAAGSLIAGRTYAATVPRWAITAPGAYSVSESIFVAQPGPFEVVIETRPLTTVKSLVSIADAYLQSPVAIEFYRSGVLTEAFEIGDREVTMQIPPGEYDVRLSGLVGFWEDPETYQYLPVILAPHELHRTVLGVPDERLDFQFGVPNSGVRPIFPSNSVFDVTALSDGRPIAFARMGFWYDRILTDLPELNLIVRGAGLPDIAASATPSEAFPELDLTQLQGPIGRLQGTVTDPFGQPLQGLDIMRYFKDGEFSDWVGTTDHSGYYDVEKVKDRVYFFAAPDAGDLLMKFVPVENDDQVETYDFSLEALEFNEVSKEGGPLQLIYGSGNRGYRIVFLAEAFTDLQETFTDVNGNGIWDGAVFVDSNDNGVWDEENHEGVETYGDRVIDYATEAGTDLTAGNEPFTDLNADGYPNIDDFAVFVQNTKHYIRSLLGTPVIAGNIEFDVYILFLPSAQAGIDVYDETETKTLDVDTRFDVGLHLNRSLLSLNYTSARAAIGAHIDRWDLQVVMLNQPVLTGRVNSFLLAAGGLGHTSPNDWVSGHEFGHNPGTLADEYNEFFGTNTDYLSPQVGHVSNRKDPTTVPWAAYIPARSDLPISLPYSSGNGIYAGAFYNAGGAYRSNWNSRMRYTGPLYNDVSVNILARAFCLRSLTSEDFVGHRNPADPLLDLIFENGFEPENGKITGLCH